MTKQHTDGAGASAFSYDGRTTWVEHYATYGEPTTHEEALSLLDEFRVQCECATATHLGAAQQANDIARRDALGARIADMLARGQVTDGVPAAAKTSALLNDTQAELDAITREMDVIYERWPKKEVREQREELLIPLRARCVEIGQRRYRLVKANARRAGRRENV